MGEASWLAGPAVDSYANIHNVADITEEIVEVLIRHLKRHVSDEEGPGWRIGLEATFRTCRFGIEFGSVILDDQVAALKDLHVEIIDSSLGICRVLVFDISKPKQNELFAKCIEL